LDKLFRFLF